jgi:ComF family protein
MRFLSYIVDFLFPPRETEMHVRSATYTTLAPLVIPMHHTINGYPCVSLLSYDHFLVRALIIEAKFKGNARAYTLLGDVLHEFLSNHAPVVLVPIPLSKERRRARGVNQVEEILRNAAPTFPIHTILARIRNTKPQTEHSADSRRNNVVGAFTADPLDPILTYLVIDDVTTTGATLTDAARALAEAGAVHIRLLALARA